MGEIDANILAAQLGNEMAFASLVRTVMPMAERFARHKWNMGNDSEDAAQRVCIRLGESLNL